LTISDHLTKMKPLVLQATNERTERRRSSRIRKLKSRQYVSEALIPELVEDEQADDRSHVSVTGA